MIGWQLVSASDGGRELWNGWRCFLILAALVGFMYLAYKIGRQFEVKLANELAAEKAEVVRVSGERDSALDGKERAKKELTIAIEKLNTVQYELDSVKAKLDAKHDKLNAKQVEIDELEKSLHKEKASLADCLFVRGQLKNEHSKEMKQLQQQLADSEQKIEMFKLAYQKQRSRFGC